MYKAAKASCPTNDAVEPGDKEEDVINSGLLGTNITPTSYARSITQELFVFDVHNLLNKLVNVMQCKVHGSILSLIPYIQDKENSHVYR